MQNKIKAHTQAQCDALLTPIVKIIHPVCILNGHAKGCTYDTQVAHHHVHKSKSLILRYNFDNLINLCHHCHLMLHMNESFWASKIVQIKGLDWFEALEKEKNKIYKPNYNEIYDKLKEKERQSSINQFAGLYS